MDVCYCSDKRYPGPKVFELPPHIDGVPTQAELDAQPRLFTWGELKGIIKYNNLEELTRNKEIQNRYEAWMNGQREKYGSTADYLIHARLPWGKENAGQPEPTFDQRTALNHPEVDLTPSTNPDKMHQRSGSAVVAAHLLNLRPPASPNPGQYSHNATAPDSPEGSGASTPSSVAYVSLETALSKVNRKLARQKRVQEAKANGSPAIGSPANGSPASSSGEAEEDDEPDIYLKYNPEKGLEEDKYAVLPNDWPYNVPYGVRHYCVWSRIPIAHPVLVDYDAKAWAKVEADGLGGFTGVVPRIERKEEANGAANGHGRSGPTEAGEGGWYAVDVDYGGKELREWAGVQYQSHGGQEVGNMVKALWPEQGWETIWFVNPARLQSVPSFSHFHVFARRKTPTEIDASERAFGTRQ